MSRFLSCNLCGTELDVPMCCENDMDEEGGMLVCSLCGSKKEVPLCCGKKMKVGE